MREKVAALPRGITTAVAPRPDVDTITALRQYRIGVGDELQITLRGTGALLGTVSVDSEGGTNLPRKGKTDVAGMTPDEVARMIEGRDGGGVDVTLIAPPDVYVAGAVTHAGAVSYQEGLTLEDLLGRVGGPTYKADLRAVRIKPRHASAEREISFDPALPILPGDVVRIGERYF